MIAVKAYCVHDARHQAAQVAVYKCQGNSTAHTYPLHFNEENIHLDRLPSVSDEAATVNLAVQTAPKQVVPLYCCTL